MKHAAVLGILGIGLVFAGVAALGGLASDRTLAEERLALDPSRANLDGPGDSAAYRIELERIGPDRTVRVEWAFRDGVNGTLTVRRSGEVTALAAPPVDGALARGDGPAGNLTFVPADVDDYALVVQSAEVKQLKGAVRVTWDPPVEAAANPIYFAVARAMLLTTLAVAAGAFVAGRVRRR